MKRRFVARAEYDAVCADRERLRTERDAAQRDLADSESAVKRMAQQNVLLSGQIEERDRRIRELTARLASFINGPSAAAHADDVAGIDFLDKGEHAYKEWLMGGKP